MFVDVRQAQELQAALCGQVEGLRPGDVLLSDAAALWRVYDGIERLASAAKVLLAQRVDESQVWAREGDRSAADYLARVSGASRGASRSLLDTSRKLRKAPSTEAALRRGELSRPQAEAIADAVAANPTAEDDLLAAASRESLAELRERCARAKAAADPDSDARHRRIRRDRRLRQYTDAEGAWNAIMRGTADAGAVFNAALQPIIDELFQQARREGRSEPRDAYAFDAAIELARRAHDRPGDINEDEIDEPADEPLDEDDITRDDDDHDVDGEGPSEAEEPGAGVPVSRRRRSKRRRGKEKSARRVNPKFLAVLRLDVESLRRGRVEGDELCEITGIGPVPVHVARELLGDAILQLVITKGVDVANVTHLGRGPTAAQRIAALWASPYCTNQGCPNVLNIQHDHREPWAQVHKTEIGNLDRLCGACHYLKTHEGWALVEGKGRRPLVPPDDPRHPNHRSSSTSSTVLSDWQVSNRTDMPPTTAPQGSHAVVSADQQPPGCPVETLRHDPTLFDNAA